MNKAHLLLGFAAVFALAVAVVVRLLVIRPGSRPAKNRESARLMILLGSGGHTGEMLRILKDVDFNKYKERIWVHYPEDEMSVSKALKFEEAKANGNNNNTNGKCTLKEIKRARKVGQAWISTIFTSITSLQMAVSIAMMNPDVIICNGPGTSVMLCLASFILKFIGFNHSRVVFIESLARVHSLSLSGMLLLPLADRFIVQWPELAAKYQRAEYHNILC